MRSLQKKLDKERIMEEQKIKEEEERGVDDANLQDELDKLRKELGGPFFTKEDNIKFKESIKVAR